MPHDKNGKLLLEGDRVLMEFWVRSVATDEDHCNLTLESVEPLYPEQYHTQLGTVNSKQVTLKQDHGE